MDTQNTEDSSPEEQNDDVQTNVRASTTMPSSRTISLARKHQARLSIPRPDTASIDILTALEFPQPDVLMLIVGDFVKLSPALETRLVQLFSRGVARTLASMNAAIVDNGCQVGVTRMIGQGVADRGYKNPLLGIAPIGQVTTPGRPQSKADPLDPNHSHFILTLGKAWGDEKEILFDVVSTLAEKASPVVLLVGGDEVAKEKILFAVRHEFPVIVLKDSGGFADNLVGLSYEQPSFVPNPDLAEIIADGKLYFLDATGPISGFERLLQQVLRSGEAGKVPSSLELAWRRFALYDRQADRQQADFNRIQFAILALGVMATFLAISYRLFQFYTPLFFGGETREIETIVWVDRALFVVLLVLPIAISVLIAAANRFSVGNKWIFLRASAEGLKKEIFRYRARVGIYSDDGPRKGSREIQLHRKEEAISRKLMQTEVNLSALPVYDGPVPPRGRDTVAEADDGFSILSPDRYLKYRLEHQLDFYQKRTIKIASQMKLLQWLIYILGGIGTFLVAIGLEIWLALTTTLVAAISAFLEYRQLEKNLIRYNQTAAELASLHSWWFALSTVEQADPDNFSLLVNQTETTIYSEHSTWVQEMQDTMAALRASQLDEVGSRSPEKVGDRLPRTG